MQAIYEGPGGAWRKRTRIQIYGWENFSFNLSTSQNTSRNQNANFPLIYDLRPNRVEQHQFVLYLERVPDEAQTDHLDWGFRISAVYGLDVFRFAPTAFLMVRNESMIDKVGSPNRFFHPVLRTLHRHYLVAEQDLNNPARASLRSFLRRRSLQWCHAPKSLRFFNVLHPPLLNDPNHR
jgi:hypothetical protein